MLNCVFTIEFYAQERVCIRKNSPMFNIVQYTKVTSSITELINRSIVALFSWSF